MSYPKWKYGKTEAVLVTGEKMEKELGDSYFENPAEAGAEYTYEGKGVEVEAVASEYAPTVKPKRTRKPKPTEGTEA